METREQDFAILLFDGVCNTCNTVVDLLLKIDHKQVFRFASIQSKVGQSLFQEYGLKTDRIDTLVLIHKKRSYLYSAAVFQTVYLLGWPWRALWVLSVIPRPITDFFYKLYAKNRYQLFGKRNSCRLPTPQERARFLEDT